MPIGRALITLVLALAAWYRPLFIQAQDVTCIDVTSDALGVKDAMIVSCVECGFSDQNFGNTQDFIAAGWTNQGYDSDVRSLIEFGFGGIPDGAQLLSATLSLYFNPTSPNGEHSTLSGSNEAWLKRITEPWQESTVTWAGQPATTDVGQVHLPETTTPDEDRPAIDVLPLVQWALDEPSSYHGWMFQLATEVEYRRMIFASSDHPDPFRHPQLEVCYSLPTGVTSDRAGQAQRMLYPDPVRDEALLDLSGAGPGPLRLTLLDAMGRSLRTWSTSVRRERFTREDLPAGSYLLLVRDARGSSTSLRFEVE